MVKGQQVAFKNLLTTEFLDLVGDAFFFFDYGLHFVFANKKGTRLLGKTKKELVGKKVTDVFPEVKKKSLYIDFLKTNKFSKKPITYYSPSLKKWLHVKVQPTRYGIAVCVQDITAQKEAEDKAKESQQILNAFFEYSPVGLAIYDEKMKFLKIDNTSAKIFFGRSAEKVVGKSLRVLAPKSAEQIDPIFQKILQENKAIVSELAVKDKHGRLFYGMSSRFPLWFANEKRGIGTITVDITDHVKSEQRKDDFIAMASHELKTPLATAKLFVQMLQRRFAKTEDVTAAKMITKVSGTIEQLESLIKGLLDATLANQGRMKFNHEKFILRDIALETVKTLQLSTKSKLKVDWQTNEYLYADREKVSQIFTNFITNAIKYSPHATDIIIRSRKDRTSIIVSVQDFGIGIPKDDQVHLFDRFYQAEKHDTYPGLGLGLYIAKEIINQMGGQIWLQSEEKKGSTFYFSLPIYHRRQKKAL